MKHAELKVGALAPEVDHFGVFILALQLRRILRHEEYSNILSSDFGMYG